MNVSLKKNDDAVSGIVKLEIVKDDYAGLVDKSLRSVRQKANVPGFRRGMVPMGLVKKMFGKQVLVDEVNKLVSESLFNYIRDNGLRVLGQPIPNMTEQKPLDFDKDENFEFCFDVALAPEIHIELSKEDKLPFYQVIVDDEMVNNQVQSYRENFGSYDKVEEVEEADILKGTVAELENGAPKEGGIVVEEVILRPSYLKNEEEKAKFIGAKVNTVVVFNPKKAYDGAEADIASLLKMDKENVAGIDADFSFEIKEILRHKDAELNQEFFDKIVGENAVSSEEEFRGKIKESMTEQFAPQSSFKFLTDARDMLEAKVGELKFADEVLKRWLQVANENSTREKIDEDYPRLVKDLKYQLIKDELVRRNALRATDDDIEQFAERVAKAQFAQYGMMFVPGDVLKNYATDMLKNKQTLQNVAERVIEEKLAEWLKEQVELEVKEVTADEFGKLFE